MHRAFGAVCLLVAMVTGLFLPGVVTDLRPFAAAYPLACALAGAWMLSGRLRLGTVFLVAGVLLLPAFVVLTAGMALTALDLRFSMDRVLLAGGPMLAAWIAATWRCGWQRPDLVPDQALAVLHMRFDPVAAVMLRGTGASVLPRAVWWYAAALALPALVPSTSAMRVAIGVLVPPVIVAAAVVLGALTAAGAGILRFERSRGRLVTLAS